MASIARVAEANLPTRYGSFQVAVYTGGGQPEHVALWIGELSTTQPTLVRLHSECLTGDVLISGRCDCGEQLEASLIEIQRVGHGVLLYLRQEGRGIGLANKIRAYALQEQGLDTVDANRALGLPDDLRDYGIAAEMLRDLGVGSVRLLTNNPLKIDNLRAHGIQIIERVPLLIEPNATNIHYLRVKQDRMGHLLNLAASNTR